MADRTLLLLQQIAENTARDNSLEVAMIAGGSAVLGALAAGLFGFLATRAQVRIERQKLIATIVSQERLRWLRELRDKTSAFYTKIDLQLGHLERPYPPAQPQALQDVLDLYYEQTSLLAHGIFPMLNRSKEDQRDLFRAVNNTLQFMTDQLRVKTPDEMDIDKAPYAALKTEAFRALENIGITAWEKVQGLK